MSSQTIYGPKTPVNARPRRRELLAHRPEIAGSTHGRIARPDARIMHDRRSFSEYRRMLVGDVRERISDQDYLERIESAERAARGFRVTFAELIAVHQDGEGVGVESVDEGADDELHALQKEIIDNLEDELRVIRDNQEDDPLGSRNLFIDTLLENIEESLEEWTFDFADILESARSHGDTRTDRDILRDELDSDDDFEIPLGEEVMGNLTTAFIVTQGTVIEKAFGVGGYIEVADRSTEKIIARYFIQFTPQVGRRATGFKQLEAPQAPFPDAEFKFHESLLNRKGSHGILKKGARQLGKQADAALAEQNVDKSLFELPDDEDGLLSPPARFFRDLCATASVSLNKQIRAKLGIKD